MQPFIFPSLQCDFVAFAFGPFVFFIALDMASGYWQILLTEASKEKTAFIVPEGKYHWNVMAMGLTNAHPAFVTFVCMLKKEWTYHATEQGLDPALFDSKVIVDDILLAMQDQELVGLVFCCVLSVCQHYQITLQLKKCWFLPQKAEFVGFDLHPKGNSPAESKFDGFRCLTKPHLFGDLQMLIGFFGFYQQFLEWFEQHVIPWHKILKQAPAPGTMSQEKEAELLNDLWKEEHAQLLATLKAEILVSPIMQQPDVSK